MTPPMIPPEAGEAAWQVMHRASSGEVVAAANGLARYLRDSDTPWTVEGAVRNVVMTWLSVNGDDGLRAILAAAHPHLRRAILETELPRIVAMAREGVEVYDPRTTEASISWHHTPASILAALNTNPGATE